MSASRVHEEFIDLQARIGRQPRRASGIVVDQHAQASDHHIGLEALAIGAAKARDTALFNAGLTHGNAGSQVHPRRPVHAFVEPRKIRPRDASKHPRLRLGEA